MLVHELISSAQKDNLIFTPPHEQTYGQFLQDLHFFRNCLHAQGIGEGSHVALFSRNSPAFILAYLAVTSLGGIIIPLNFQLTEMEIAYILKDAQAELLLTTTSMNLPVKQMLLSEFSPRPDLETPPPAPVLPPDWDPKHPCAIIYTSGTTGHPKGAVLSHDNLVANIAAFQQIISLTAQDRILCVLPMYHCFAWTCCVLGTLRQGASLYILDNFVPKETLSVLREQKITAMYGVPPMFNLFCRLGSKKDFASLKYIVSGGASLPEEISRSFYEKFQQEIIEGYGLSEASPIVTVNPPQKVKRNSIGKPLPGITLSIRDDDGTPLPSGQVGELTVQGPNVMLRYYNLPVQTALTLQNGYLRTGDLAYADAEGYFHIVDRLKDMVIVNGENVYPREIEELLYAYPGILEVAVIGVKDELRGQAVRAYLVVSEDCNINKKVLRDYLQERLAAYKIPREFVIVDSLPKTSTGKILKRELRT